MTSANPPGRPRAYPGRVLTTGFAGKTNALARLVTMSAVGGVLVAGILLPAIGGIGVTARNAADKFQALSATLPNQLPQRSEMLDSKGHVLAYFYAHPYGQPDDVIDRVPVSFSKIAPVMREAIVAIEDSRFYQHGGLDVKGTVRAAVEDLRGSNVQGGSTIAQQYVKNVLILTAKNEAQAQVAASDTLARKIRELRYAVAVEHQIPKNQLLADYLNAAYFGQQAYGVQVAAERYFSRSAADLTLPQAALLAGIVENPSAYDPIGNAGAALARRNTVLARMAQLGAITQAQATAAENTKLHLHPSMEPNGCTASYAPFFCDYVYQVIDSDPAFHQAASLLDGIGGLRIHTTLRPSDQQAAQHAVDYLMPARSEIYNPGNNADTEVLIQPGTGKVRAMAIDRRYGMNASSGETVVNYAVGPQYDGSYGVQIGSTGKVYVMVTALLQGIPFGFKMTTPQSTTIRGFTNCKGLPAGRGTQAPVRGRCTTTRARAAGATRCTRVLPSPSTRSSRAWSRRSVSASLCRPPARWGSPGLMAHPCSTRIQRRTTRTARTTIHPSRSARTTSRRSTWQPQMPLSLRVASTVIRCRSARSLTETGRQCRWSPRDATGRCRPRSPTQRTTSFKVI